MDRGQSRVRDMVLYVYSDPNRDESSAGSTEHPTLYVQTSRALIHAIDAETGQTLWAKTIGRPEHPSMTPGVYRDLLATATSCSRPMWPGRRAPDRP